MSEKKKTVTETLFKKKNQESENLGIKNTAELTQILVNNPRKMKLFRKTVVLDDFLPKNCRFVKNYEFSN